MTSIQKKLTWQIAVGRINQVFKVANASDWVKEQQLRTSDEGRLSIETLVVLVAFPSIFVREKSRSFGTVQAMLGFLFIVVSQTVSNELLFSFMKKVVTYEEMVECCNQLQTARRNFEWRTERLFHPDIVAESYALGVYFLDVIFMKIHCRVKHLNTYHYRKCNTCRTKAEFRKNLMDCLNYSSESKCYLFAISYFVTIWSRNALQQSGHRLLPNII